MTPTIRRKRCKTRREWADKIVEGYGMLSEETAATYIRVEHARAVRIVKRAKRLELHGLRDTDTNEFLEGYEAACVDILAALSKGRA